MGIRPIYVFSDSSVKGAISLPLIQIRYLKPSINFLEYDYLIFTSKRGVKAAENIDKNWKKLPALAIGKATAKAIEKMGGKVVFVSKLGYGDDFAKEIERSFSKSAKYLYLRSKRVVSSLSYFLRQNGFKVKEAIVYETFCNQDQSLLPPPKGAILLFSSPSTIDCFFKRFSWDSSYKAIAIGKKTASFFPGEIVISPYKDLQKSVEWIEENFM